MSRDRSRSRHRSCSRSTESSHHHRHRSSSKSRCRSKSRPSGRAYPPRLSFEKSKSPPTKKSREYHSSHKQFTAQQSVESKRSKSPTKSTKSKSKTPPSKKSRAHSPVIYESASKRLHDLKQAILNKQISRQFFPPPPPPVKPGGIPPPPSVPSVPNYANKFILYN